jgi:hypothetical protein
MLTPVPPLASIGHQLYHGGGSISSNMVLTKKMPTSADDLPLGITLMPAFLLKHCFSCKTPFLPQKHVNNDDNLIILLATY